jgi:ABC-2 type transport system ATP-binding protein
LIADHLIVIGGGRLLCDMPLSEFIANNSRLEVDLVCSDSARVGEALESSGGHILARDGAELRIAGLSARQVGEVVAGAGAIVWGLRDVNTSLEEAFMDITKDTVAFGGQRTDGGQP